MYTIAFIILLIKLLYCDAFKSKNLTSPTPEHILLKTYNGTAIIAEVALRSSEKHPVQKFSLALDSLAKESVLAGEKECYAKWCQNVKKFHEPEFMDYHIGDFIIEHHRLGAISNEYGGGYLMEIRLEFEFPPFHCNQTFHVVEETQESRYNIQWMFDSAGNPIEDPIFDGVLSLASTRNVHAMSLLSNLIQHRDDKMVSLWVSKNIQNGAARLTVGRPESNENCFDEWQFTTLAGGDSKDEHNAIENSWNFSITLANSSAFYQEQEQRERRIKEMAANANPSPFNAKKSFEKSSRTRIAVIDTLSQDILIPQSDFEEFVNASKMQIYKSEIHSSSMRCDRKGLPDLLFFIGNKSYTIPPENYLVQIGSGICHLAIRSWNNNYWSLGHPFLRTYCVAFNVGTNERQNGSGPMQQEMIGFALSSGMSPKLAASFVLTIFSVFTFICGFSITI